MPQPRQVIPHVLAALMLGALVACGGPRAGAPDLAIDRVVIYQSGIAYIERHGTVSGDSLTMQIRPDQINDLLGSIVVVDHSGAGSTTVSLPVSPAYAARLSALPPEIQNDGGIRAILYAFRGAEVTVRAGRSRTSGRITGVEHIDGVETVTIITPRDRLVPIAVEDIDRVALRSETLAIALERSLDRSLSDGDWKPLEVTVRFADSRRRDVSMAYVVELPIWKPVYRAVVSDDGVLLQGWALVDNVSGENWDNIRLGLTAGTPISFRYDLHTPVFIDRPDMTGYGRPSTADLRPPTPAPSALAQESATRSRSARPASAPAPAPARDSAGFGAGGARGESAESRAFAFDDDAPGVFDAPTSIAGESADVSELASLFMFTIPGRVSLPDQTSTLVTIMNESLDGLDALVFQPGSGQSASHPYRSLLLTNDTSFPVQQAPITIYRDGAFVGEGITTSIAPGETAFVSYALEARVRVDQRRASESGTARLVRIVDGRIIIETEGLDALTFNVTSSLNEAQTLYVRVPRSTGFELQNPPEGTQTHSAFYLVPLAVDAVGTSSHTVRQVTRRVETLEATDTRARTILLAYLDRPDARPDIAEQLRPVRANMERLADLERQLVERRALREDIQVRTHELRSNIAALGDAERNRELRTTLLTRLAEQEDLFTQLAAQIVEINEEISALRVQISEQIRSISLSVN